MSNRPAHVDFMHKMDSVLELGLTAQRRKLCFGVFEVRWPAQRSDLRALYSAKGRSLYEERQSLHCPAVLRGLFV